MYPCAFDYFRAHSLPQAIELLTQHGDEARPLAGGQSLIPLMKLRLATPSVLIDINPIPALDHVRVQGGWLEIGPLARHADVSNSAFIAEQVPLIQDAVLMVGDAQVRNLGTVAGAMAEADPGGDWGAVLLALNGEIACAGSAGERVISGAEFFTDFYTTALGPTELITNVRLRMPGLSSGGAYLKLERRAGDFAVVGAAVQVTLDADGTCRDAGIGLTGVASTPLKPLAAEAALLGTTLREDAVAEAVREIDAVIDPSTDTRAPADYRRKMIAVFFRRALERARQRASSDGSPSP